jgi:diguanylate cyclase (GGDEF)-like protein
MIPIARRRFDPPLRRRLLWQDPLSADTLISEDRGLMARAYGTLTLVGILLALVILTVHADPGRNYALLAAVVAVDLALSGVCFLVYRRLPIWFFHFATVLGIVLIDACVAGESRDAAAVLSLSMIWIVLLANLFFSVRAAFAYTLLAAVSLGLVLLARDVDYWQRWAVASFVFLGSAGTVVGWLRRRLETVAAQLDEEAKTDSVTGLANRRGFNQRCDLELARTRREHAALSLIACDLDGFKRVNDELGHDEGDVALRTVAQTISTSVRAVDAVGRLGGEEFGIVLPGADRQEAESIAERIRTGVREAFKSHPVPITISCGVAIRSGAGESRETLLQQADEALYAAKRRGRNRTVVADPHRERALAAG